MSETQETTDVQTRRIKRDIKFVEAGQLAVALGIPHERLVELEKFVSSMIGGKKSLQQIIEAMNERGDLTDAEWTATVFSIGYFQGTLGA